MFSFFAWVALIGNIISALLNFVRYQNLEESLFLSNAYSALFMGIILFAVFIRLSHMEDDIEKLEELSSQNASLFRQINILEQKVNPSKTNARSSTADEDARVAQSAALYAKYDTHIVSITASINAGRYETYDLFYRDVFSPKEWRENTMGNRETWFALYDYYNKLLPLLIEWKSAQPLVNEVCEEAYRLTGFLGINLNGQNSDIMSYMCDVEQSANGNSQRLTTICKKLDSIGALDRGQPFGNRLR